MRSTVFVAGCLVAVGTLLAADVLTPKLADAFAKKIEIVQKQAQSPSRTARATSFSQPELNSYLRFEATDLLPAGLTEPHITLIGKGRVTGRAVVDLDIVRAKKGSGGWLDPTSYLMGKLPVVATGLVIADNGAARVEVERVEVGGVPVPKSLLAQLVNYFTRTADNPSGSNLDDTFDMPAKIRRITVDAGRFTVIQ